MKIKITCPENPEHTRFSVTAHVSQEWEVDDNGEFQKCLQAHMDTVHHPDSADMYLCLQCPQGVQAKAELIRSAIIV